MDDRATELERALERATEYAGPETELWRAAVSGESRVSPPRRVARWRVDGPVAAAACVLLLVLAALVTTPMLGRARMPSQVTPSVSVGSPAAAMVAGDAESGVRFNSAARGMGAADARARAANLVGSDLFAGKVTGGAGEPSGFARRVIRTARVELRVEDVDVASRAARALVHPEEGEYVQEAGLRGEAPWRRGTLVLRVRAERAEAVVGALSELGVVLDQKIEGRDVTERVVDLGARLRNERRIEAELLTLLDERDDSPLEDVLLVRTELGRVRETIERLTGELATLERMVSLATVTVELESGEPPPEHAGTLATIRDALGGAIRAGGEALLASVAFIVEVVVGGLVWWAVVLIAGVGAYRRWRATRAWA